MIRVFYTLLFIFLLNGPLLAQKETSFWFNRFYSFDFNTYPPPPVNLTAASNYQAGRASIADQEGKLLFYSDGLNYYDRTGALMPNGQGIAVSWGTTELPYLIAPVPGTETQFYLFTVRLPKSDVQADFDWALRYSKIDMQMNSGKGDVIEKDIIIHANARDEFTLIKTSDDANGYWLVCVDRLDGNALLNYRISSSGISAQPVVTPVGSFIKQSNFKASPDGKYLAINTTPSDGTHRFKIFSFNSKGGFTLHREIVSTAPDYNVYPHTEVFYSNPEFSSDSRFIYVLKDSTFYPEINKFRTFKTLLCYDMAANSADNFLASKKIIFNFPEGEFPVSAKMQLSPQRKIIIGDLIRSGYFSTIHNPNSCSVEGKNFEFKSIPVPMNFFLQPPSFAPWYFYEPDNVVSDHAGKDTLICSSQSVILGKAPKPGFKYTWEPAPGLSNLSSPNPVFHAVNTTEKNDTTTLLLTIEDALGCSYNGTTKVITKPVNKWKIQGSRSVCPGVKEVKYWIENAWTGKTISWQVDGGSIVTGQNTDTILVNWGPTNPTASVRAISINDNGCDDILDPFPVKVFKFLDTETPSGKDTLACNNYTERYKIISTNGSLYDWQLINGTILEGQGTAQVNIKWDASSLYSKVWINESVNTELETCFGRSDTLVVLNPHQMLSQNLFLFSISGTVENNESLEIIYKLNNPEFYKPEIFLQRRSAESGWIELGTTGSMEEKKIFTDQPLSQGVYQYRLLAFNVCGDSVKSTVHKNILLRGEILPENNIQLSWNHYETWESGLPSYRLYRKLDDQNDFTQIGLSSLNSYVTGNNTDGFVHTFYVTARSPDNLYSSLSNKVIVEFAHELFMPNVITPNGDAKNDTWSPYPLEPYKENELIIFDRRGKTVYHADNYTGTWDGSGLPTGVYFYEFRLNRNQKRFKGFIQIIR